MKKSKIISCFLAIVMIASLASICAFAWDVHDNSTTDIPGFICYTDIYGSGPYCSDYATAYCTSGYGTIDIDVEVVTFYDDYTYDFAHTADTLYITAGNSYYQFVDSSVNSSKTVSYLEITNTFRETSTYDTCVQHYTLYAGIDF